MKRWVCYLAVLAVVLMLGGQETDVGLLKPAEVLYIYIEDDRVAAATDTGDCGVGYDLERALGNMKASADGELFLETVAYLLVTEETKVYLEQLLRILRPGTEVVLTAGPVELEIIANYFAVHKPNMQLRECLAQEVQLPKLMKAGERYYLVQP